MMKGVSVVPTQTRGSLTRVLDYGGIRLGSIRLYPSIEGAEGRNLENQEAAEVWIGVLRNPKTRGEIPAPRRPSYEEWLKITSRIVTVALAGHYDEQRERELLGEAFRRSGWHVLEEWKGVKTSDM